MPLSDFLQRYPEFEKLDPKLIELFLLDAQTEVSQARWGKMYERGVMALAAHLLKLHAMRLEDDGEAIQALASESAGELSVSYAPTMSAANEQDYRLTAYGQEYLRLKRLVGVGIMVA